MVGMIEDIPKEVTADLDAMTPEQLEAMEYQMLAIVARGKDDPDGFAAFFRCITGMELPTHGRDWVNKIYQARESKKHPAIMAFRGSAKTTIVTHCFTAFRIGHGPELSNLLIQVGDDIAADNAAHIADLIQNNPRWKMVFPNIEPDIERGWGAAGYEVKRTDISYEEWRLQNATRKDPTLLGVGYKSRAIIGKRPTGVLIVDDILDENNTVSERELMTVEKILTGVIFPTMVDETWLIFTFTPWLENDPVVRVTRGDNFQLMKTPVYKVSLAEEPGAIFWHGDWVQLTWPGRFTAKNLEDRWILSGTVEFARMYLLDLTKTSNQVFKRHGYPADRINTLLPMYGGVDYAGTMSAIKNALGRNDYFALAYVCKLPEGGAVVVDGFLGHVTQEQAETQVEKAQGMFPAWQFAVVEGDGKGEEFIQVLLRRPHLNIVPMKTGGKGKVERLERQMSPWFESMRVRISDAETPFLNELRREMDTYPNNEHDDALDAVYWALRGIPDALTIPGGEELPQTKQKKRRNPFLAFGGR